MTKKLKNPKPSPWQQYQNAGAGNSQTNTSAPTKAAPRNITTATTTCELYQGHELKPYTGRPGAMKAYSLPSLIQGQRTPRKAPICTPSQKA